ncbi:MAG: LPS export ABC transporter periplasmic protein LptC [Desulfobacterales bacterium]|nr:LPS export ABC transporter periplasmic protein LptC [Desulfobacterales bacterium]
MLTAAVAALGVLIAVYVGGRREVESRKGLLEATRDSVDHAIRKTRQMATRDGKKEWDLAAGSIRYVGGENQAICEDLEMVYYTRDQGRLFLTASQGIWQTDSNDLDLSGEVVVKNEDYRLETTKLLYRHEKRTMFTTTPVTISGPSAHLTADAMTVDLETKKALLKGNVKGRLNGSFIF